MNNDGHDEAAEARRYAVNALKVSIAIADNPNSDPVDRENARQILEKCLLRLRKFRNDPDLSPDLRRDLEDTLQKLR
jgi:hypothetical protein